MNVLHRQHALAENLGAGGQLVVPAIIARCACHGTSNSIVGDQNSIECRRGTRSIFYVERAAIFALESVQGLQAQAAAVKKRGGQSEQCMASVRRRLIPKTYFQQT